MPCPVSLSTGKVFAFIPPHLMSGRHHHFTEKDLNSLENHLSDNSIEPVPSVFDSKMATPQPQLNLPPPGYPTENPPPTTGGKKKWFARSKKKGERGFIEGCLFALCCCWICEECCF